MELPETNELEKFIHAQLQKLPERDAPESLVTNVLAAIAAREKLPWWKQPFMHWPRGVQSTFFVALGAVFGGVLYGAGRAADTVSQVAVSEKVPSFGWIGTTVRSVGEALFLALGSLRMEWFLAIAIVFVLLYGACLAAGFALFKVTAGTVSRPA
jgi:hypothetical protein